MKGTTKLVIIGIPVISLIILGIILLIIYLEDPTVYDKQPEFNGYRFQPAILYYSETDRDSKINSKWQVNGGTGFNGTNFFVHNVLLDKKSLFIEAWLELKDGNFISDQHNCNYDTICFGDKNPIGYLLIEVEDPSIIINTEGILKANHKVLDIKNFTNHEGFNNAKILTIDLSTELELWNKEGNNAYPLITIVIPTEFRDPCIFSNDYVTCEINLKIQKDIEEIKINLGDKK